MLAKISRFRGRNSLHAIYKYGQTVSDKQLSIKYLKLTKEKPPRIAVVVSRKVNKSAVTRNRIRRRMYEQLRLKTTEKKLNSDIILVVYSDDYATVKSPELSKTLDHLLNKSQVLENK